MISEQLHYITNREEIFYFSNKKSHPQLYEDNFKNDDKINFN